MKNRATSIMIAAIASSLIILLVGMTLTPAHADVPSEPHGADAMWVEPSSVFFTSTNASIGTKLNVTIWLNMTEDIFTYQVALKYNRTQLMCSRAGYTAGATSVYFTGHTTNSPPPVVDSGALGNGSVLAFETVLDDDNITGPHSGSLIWAEFSLLMMPASGNLTSIFDITSTYPAKTWVEDTNLNNINISTFGGTLTVTPEFPYLLLLPIFMASTLVAVALSKRHGQRKLK